MAAANHPLLDPNAAVNLELLETVVSCVYAPGSTHAERAQAQEVLNLFQNDPGRQLQCQSILELAPLPAGHPGKGNRDNTRFYGLLVLHTTITTRWNILPREQTEGIKNYLVNKIIGTSSDPVQAAGDRMFLRKMNETLVQAR